MRKNLSLLCAMLVVIGLSQIALAANYTWTQLGAGPFNWTDPNNWSTDGTPGTYPDGAGTVVNMNVALTGSQDITMPSSPITLGILNVGGTASVSYYMHLGTSIGQGQIIFDNPGGTATINSTKFNGAGGVYDYLNSSIVLHQNLTIASSDAGTSSYLRLRAPISESGGSFGVSTTPRDPGTGLVNGIVYIGGTPNTYTGVTNLGTRTILSDVNANPNTTVPGNLVLSGNGGYAQWFTNDVVNSNADISLVGTLRSIQGGGSSQTIGSLSGNPQVPSITPWIEQLNLTIKGLRDADFPGSFAGGTTFSFTKQGNSTQTLSGQTDNAMSTVTVTGGILALNKTPTGTPLVAHNAVSGALVVGDGAGHGEMKLLQSDQIADASGMTLTGGKFNLNGCNEVLSTLTVGAGSSVLDMGVGSSTAVVTFANSSATAWTGTLQILDWNGAKTGGGTEQLNFGPGGLTTGAGSQISQIQFLDPAGFAPGTYTAQILASGEVVPVGSFLPGDANQDGKVSFADYILLANNFGQTGATWQMGDFNGDGKVSFADYILLANNFGQHTPEPATLGLLLIGGLGLIRRNRK